MSEVKIEHFENDIQICNFVFTSPSGDQQIAWEGDADYLAVKQLQATIAEQGAEIAELTGIVESVKLYFSDDSKLDVPQCCSGSIQSECGCRGITDRQEIYYELQERLAKHKDKP